MKASSLLFARIASAYPPNPNKTSIHSIGEAFSKYHSAKISPMPTNRRINAILEPPPKYESAGSSSTLRKRASLFTLLETNSADASDSAFSLSSADFILLKLTSLLSESYQDCSHALETDKQWVKSQSNPSLRPLRPLRISVPLWSKKPTSPKTPPSPPALRPEPHRRGSRPGPRAGTRWSRPRHAPARLSSSVRSWP